jgi:RNA polymerase-binding transcription factor DksA
MAKDPQAEVRQRLERERTAAIDQIRVMRPAPATAEPARAHARERQDLESVTRERERLARRIDRLTAALERVDRGTYGTCEVCHQAIEPQRLAALPEAETCRRCQERVESLGEREPAA